MRSAATSSECPSLFMRATDLADGYILPKLKTTRVLRVELKQIVLDEGVAIEDLSHDPLGNLGLGEPIVFLFMGPVMVMGSYFVQVEELTRTAFLVSLPVAFIVTAILHCNNLRDIMAGMVS